MPKQDKEGGQSRTFDSRVLCPLKQRSVAAKFVATLLSLSSSVARTNKRETRVVGIFVIIF